MRVLDVVSSPVFGGAVNQTLRLHGPLLERGWELIAVLPDEPGDAAPRLRAAGVEVATVPVHRLRATRSPRPHLSLARHAAGDVAALRTQIRRHRAAVVVNHGDLNPWAGLAGHLEGAGVHWQLLDSRTPAALRRVTMPVVTRLADSMSVWGSELARLHPETQSLGERRRIVYGPVDVSRFADAPERRARARRELAIPCDAVCFGAIGVRNPQKGHEWLVRAAALARRGNSRIVVRVLGAPSPGHEAHDRALRAEAAALGLGVADGSFEIVDPGSRVPELIAGLDVLGMTSVPRSEGIPTVILEAMAAGLPVLATRVGSVADAVADGVTGILVPALDPAAFAAAMTELAADAQVRSGLGAAGRARLHEHFTLDRLADLHAAGYADAVRRRLARPRRAAALAFGNPSTR